MRCWLIIILSGWLSFSIYGVTIIVEKGQDINPAIQLAGSGDTVLIRKDFKICSQLILKDNIVLRGEDQTECKLNFGGVEEYFIQARNLTLVRIENLSLISVLALPYGLFYGENTGEIQFSQVSFIDGNQSIYCLNSRIRVQNCQFSNYRSCIELEKSYGEISGSDFRSEENCLISKGLSADTLRIVTNRFLAGKSIIYLESIGMPCVIRGNLFNSLSSNSLINATASPVVFSFNRVFFNQQNTSISINQTSDCKIDHNVFTSNGTGSAFSLSNVVTAVCENNTFYNFQTIITNYSSMLSFINNIAFLEPGSTASAIVNVGSFPNVIRYNDFYGYLSYYSGITNHDLSVGNFSDDPLFVSRDPEDTLNYLCLECNSPGIDQGDPDYSAGEEPNSSLRIDLGYTGGYSRACGRLSVGIDGHNQSEAITRPDPLVIFPQPSEGRVRAMLVGEIRPGGGWVRIYHVSGQEIATVWVNDIREFEINGSAWNSGVYLISIESGDRRYTGKMVIIH